MSWVTVMHGCAYVCLLVNFLYFVPVNTNGSTSMIPGGTRGHPSTHMFIISNITSGLL